MRRQELLVEDTLSWCPAELLLAWRKEGRWIYHMADRIHADSPSQQPPHLTITFKQILTARISGASCCIRSWYSVTQWYVAIPGYNRNMSDNTTFKKALRLLQQTSAGLFDKNERTTHRPDCRRETQRSVLTVREIEKKRRTNPTRMQTGRDSQCGPSPEGSRHPELWHTDSHRWTPGQSCPQHHPADRIPSSSQNQHNSNGGTCQVRFTSLIWEEQICAPRWNLIFQHLKIWTWGNLICLTYSGGGS